MNDKPERNRVIAGFLPSNWRFLAALGKMQGFVSVGIAPSGPVNNEAVLRYERWLSAGYHAGLTYMARHLEPRFNPSHDKILAEAEAIVVAAIPYGVGAMNEGFWRHVAYHARGRDYHKTFKNRLRVLAESIVDVFPEARWRVFVDSAPVMERTWAMASGIGTLMKNGCIGVEGVGPRVLLGEIVLSGVPRPNQSMTSVPFSMCGECSQCIEACPSGAIVSPGVVDSNRCLSYWTIERGDCVFPGNLEKHISRIFGCDICTSVCPQNNFSVGTALENMVAAKINRSIPDLLAMLSMQEHEIRDQLLGTVLLRTGVRNLKKNIQILLNNLDTSDFEAQKG